MSGMNINRRRASQAVDGQQSLLSVINRFVQAVDSMDDTVMIPCRLRDIAVDSVTTTTSICEENNNNKAVVPAGQINGDLYDFYVMLHAIRSEIIAGPKATAVDEKTDNLTDNINENHQVSENARKTAAAFRFHLRGLFGLLHQLTETAKVLSSRYEREVSSAQNGVSSVSSFNM